MVPSVGSFFTPIQLVDAFREYDEFFALSRRRYVPPNFAELRHVLNLAQVALLLTHHPPAASLPRLKHWRRWTGHWNFTKRQNQHLSLVISLMSDDEALLIKRRILKEE